MVDLSPMTVMALHRIAMETSNDTEQGIRDFGALESALARQSFLRAYGKNDPVELSVAVAVGLVQNHPFVDGNKRTAWQVLAWLLHAHGLQFTPPSPTECAGMLRQLATHSVTESEFLSWVRRGCSCE